MKRIFFLFALASVLHAAEIAGIPRDSNFGNTGGYDATRIQAQLFVNVKDSTKVVHFIRDNNDPRVVTKTYLLKNVDAYDFRDYLRQMVQAKRVGNSTLSQQYPGNTTTVPYQGTLGAAVLPTAGNATVQPGYNPTVQLGSNTAVECLKYVDGTGLLLISAEEYRFRDHENGMGFDSLVEFLDKPAMGASYGTQTFLYIPKFVPAANLSPMIQNVGMNVTDVTEIWQGQDLVACDNHLNWLIFDVTNYSMANIEKMLKLYDVPIPQCRLHITVYEIDSENDDRMGIDFQAWKNNEGADFFSVGGRYRDNWSATYGGAMGRTGSERSSWFNFNPKWNSRYIDFLQSIGKAHAVCSGELLIRNNTPASMVRGTQIFFNNVTGNVNGAVEDPDLGVRAYKLLSSIINKAFSTADPEIPVAKAKARNVNRSITVTNSSGEEETLPVSFGFSMTVSKASVNLKETLFRMTLSNSSLIGFESNGTPRLSSNNIPLIEVSLPHGTDTFVIGGLKKQTVVKSSTGIPWLMDIPYLGYLFSTKSRSVKTTELAVAGQIQWDAPSDRPELNARTKAYKTP